MAYPYLTDVVNDFLGTDFHLPIATFGIFVALAILAAIHLTIKEVNRLIRESKLGLNIDQSSSTITEMAFLSTLAGIVGAKIFDVIEQFDAFLKAPIDAIFSTGGFSIYGGLILGILTGIVYVRHKTIAVLPMLDAVAPALSLGYAIGRLGCQFSGDGDWGKAANMQLKPEWVPDWLWAQTYENNILNIDISSPGVYPTPLYEAFMATIIFAILWQLRKKLAVTGQLFFLYLILSASARWLIEYIRINPLYELFGVHLSQAQIISAGLILISVVGIMIIKIKSKPITNNPTLNQLS